MDRRQLIAAIVEKSGIKLTEDDPAFLIVDLNLMMLESQTSAAANQLATATEKFNAVTTRNVDDFVAVANEVLSKFIQRTNEIKTALDNLTPKSALTAAVTLPDNAPISKKEPPGHPLWWLLPLIFAVGVLIGVVLTCIALK